MNVKLFLKSKVDKNRFMYYLYNKIYLRYVLRKKNNVTISQNHNKNNIVEIAPNTYCDDLKIIFKGKNNLVKIGKGCNLKKTNIIYIQNDGNKLFIGDNVTFDQDVMIVLGEGTCCSIGSESIFAKGVRIRTCDQHFIYDKSDRRINPAKNVQIGNHVWCGASVIIMKGATIGDGSVIGMDSMVIKDIPSHSLAVGKPAKVIKENIYWKEY